MQTIGSKKVNIRTQGQENLRMIVILTILASGEKLSPFLIFKAKEEKDTETKLQQIECAQIRDFVFWKKYIE